MAYPKIGVQAEVKGYRDFMGKLGKMQEKYSVVREVRGKGLMIGIEFHIDVKGAVAGCLKQGLLVGSAGANVLRLLPPLNVTRAYVSRALNILEGVIGTLKG